MKANALIFGTLTVKCDVLPGSQCHFDYLKKIDKKEQYIRAKKCDIYIHK